MTTQSHTYKPGDFLQVPVMDPARVREVQAERIARLEALVLMARDDLSLWLKTYGTNIETEDIIAAIDAELKGTPSAQETAASRATEWQLVPKELTQEMLLADPYGMGYGRIHAIWSRLLAAAPKPPESTVSL